MKYYVFLFFIYFYLDYVLAEKYTYQAPVIFKTLGSCVTLEAQIYFKRSEKEIITWQKDSKPLNQNSRIRIRGKSVQISSLQRTDDAYYQVTVVNPDLKVVEVTDIWLTINVCGKHQKEERPISQASCKVLCTDKCPRNWVYVKDSATKCFRYFDKRETWAKASENCQSIGGELATIDTIPDNEFAGSMLETANGGWIGLNDRNKENQFNWNFNLKVTPKFYTWGKGEPSNYNTNCNIENCALLKNSNGKWIDYVCRAFRPYVCEVTRSYNGSDKSEWKCSNEKCFRFYNDRLTWRDAHNRCQDKSGRLAEIRSFSENNFVQAICLEDAWIGLNDIWEAGVYTWNNYQGYLDTQKNMFLNWNNGEPNDKFTKPFAEECPGEDCVQIRKFSGAVTWHDLSCGTKIPYICEKIRDQTFSTGAYVGMVIGCLILLAIIAGVIQTAYEKRKRTAVKDIIKAAYKQDLSQREKSKDSVISNPEIPLIVPVKYD